MTLWRNLVVALVAAFALAACSSSSDNGTDTGMTEPPTTVEPEPTPAESQMALIEAAQAELETALAALDADDPTQGQIDDVTAAMDGLSDRLDAANDLSPNQTEEARDDLAAAMTVARDAQTTLNTGIATAGRIEMQTQAISDAEEALDDALEGDEIADLGAANAAYAALEAAIDDGRDLTDAQKADAITALNMADVTIANAEIAKYEADAMADGATLQQMLAAYQGKLMAAQRLAAATAASASDLAKANMVIGAAGAKIAQLEEDIQDAKDGAADERRLAANAVSMKVAEAINKHDLAGDPSSEFLVPTPALTAAQGTNFGVSRVSGDAMISLSQSTAAAKEKPYAESAAPGVMGFMGRQFSNTDTSGKRPVTEMAVVYTDIEMAGEDDWASTTFPSGTVTAASGEVAFGTESDRAIRFSGTGILPGKPTTGSVSNLIRTQAQITAGNTAIIRRPGSFYGVSGTYVCPASIVCTVTRTAGDQVTITGLNFEPTGAVAELMAKYADPDTDYTYFGYWMDSATQRDGTVEHDIETFHGGAGNLSGTAAAGNADGTTPNLSEVEGTAKYYGAAAGVYVKKDGAGDSLVVTDGTFTADAMLTARFGGPAIAADDAFEVEGTISGFMDGSTDLGFADLELNKAPIDQTTDTADPPATVAGRFSGETDGGGTSGNWSGQFFGNAGLGGADGTTDTGVDPDDTGPRTVAFDNHPTDVSGEFNGHFTNGHVAGAFGAEKD